MTALQTATIIPTAAELTQVQQLTQIQQAIAAHLQAVDVHPDRRVGAYSCSQFHKPALQFPVGCLSAADRFGGEIVDDPGSAETLRNIPTFLVLTENELDNLATLAQSADFPQVPEV
ncbi:MAG: hypothetical protein AAF728_18385 [Cyanobacteria bacterium P01_D01_bin.128]